MGTIVASLFLTIFSVATCAANAVNQKAVTTKAENVLESCAAFSPGTEEFVTLPTLRVGLLGSDEDFELPEDAPKDTSFIQCERTDLLPRPSDYKVLAAGWPLVIASGDRVASLEVSESRVNFRALTGEFTDDEIPLIQAYVNRAQRLLDATGDEA
jgi:hypothetical protein